MTTLTQVVAAEIARSEAHSTFLRFTSSVHETMASTLAFQTSLLERFVGGDVSLNEILESTSPPHPRPLSPFGGEGRTIDPSPSEVGPKLVPVLDRAACLEFAIGSLARVLGPEFGEIDSFPSRVRLPDEPLMLVDRILEINAVPRSLSSGRVLTEHDVRAGAWYLDGGRAPTCIAVEAGQADLFLSGYLGIDFHTRGQAVYRLLDAVIRFHRGLPEAGSVLRYDIHIDHFFRQGETILFRFWFEGTVDGEPLLSMRNGVAGFFSAEELAAGKGVVQTELDRRPLPGIRPPEGPLVPMRAEFYSKSQVDALRSGDLARAFGPEFTGRRLAPSLCLPDGRMRLVDRVIHLDPNGGRYGVGLIRAEAEIDPHAWFLTCHFVDDQVMPGTLMYECCLHTLRIFLLRIGWVAEEGDGNWEPVPEIDGRLKCRGQVTATTQVVTYEVTLKEWGYRPEPYALADALMYADGKPIVEMNGLSLRLTGMNEARLRHLWSNRKPAGALFDHDRILAFAVGKPSVAFGEPYRIFDEGRIIARLPGPPYQFLDRITRIDCEPWKMVAGGSIVAEYDVPPDAWYFAAERQPTMPFSVLLEVALQPCGWLAAYIGSALTSPIDLSFRNLGGKAELLRPVRPDEGTLTIDVKITSVSASAGMILQNYTFEVRSGAESIYKGTTSFGFFSKTALSQQVGMREARLYEPDAVERGRAAASYPTEAPFPTDQLRMLDRIETLIPNGGPAELGFIQGTKRVDPTEWFFAAHFYQDPVCPGSLGLESFLQLLKFFAADRWQTVLSWEGVNLGKHEWLYRGQVVPKDSLVTVQAVITDRDDVTHTLKADGFLAVDGRIIYRMKDFTLTAGVCR